jgi:hypothetical protein
MKIGKLWIGKFWMFAIVIWIGLFIFWAFYLVPMLVGNLRIAEADWERHERVERYEAYLARRGYTL